MKYCISKLYPGTVGDECFMTKGHYHAVPATAEVYLCLRGRGRMMMKTARRRVPLGRIHSRPVGLRAAVLGPPFDQHGRGAAHFVMPLPRRRRHTITATSAAKDFPAACSAAVGRSLWKSPPGLEPTTIPGAPAVPIEICPGLRPWDVLHGPPVSPAPLVAWLGQAGVLVALRRAARGDRSLPFRLLGREIPRRTVSLTSA